MNILAFHILSTNLLKFTPERWKKVSRKIVFLVRDDARKGIFQNSTGVPDKAYYNKQYAELKGNRFKRKTYDKGRGKNSKRITATKLGKNKRDEGFAYTNKNKMLKSKTYGSGWRVKNSDTSVVNMKLTGATLDSFKEQEDKSNNYITMGFDATHTDKIQGNARAGLGRQLVGLNDKNILEIKKIIIQGLKENLSKLSNEEINILIKL